MKSRYSCLLCDAAVPESRAYIYTGLLESTARVVVCKPGQSEREIPLTPEENQEIETKLADAASTQQDRGTWAVCDDCVSKRGRAE